MDTFILQNTYAPAYAGDTDLYDLEVQETALVAYTQAIQLAPREAVLHYHMGQILEHLGKDLEAHQAYEEARRLGHDA